MTPKRKGVQKDSFFVLAFFFELRQRHRKMNSLMRAQFIALRRLGTALLFQVKVIQGVAEFKELCSMSVQLQATEGEPKKALKTAGFQGFFALYSPFFR